MRRIAPLSAAALLLLALLLTTLAPLRASAEELKLGIVHVNDTHGHLQPFRVHGEDGWGGFARLRVAIQRQRSDTGYYWLTLHAGDAFQGTPLSNLLTGFLDIECMNQMGFDAMCLGNHEFDFGYALIRGRLADANFHVLSANIIDRERGGPVAEPYAILRRGDYRIGIIGVTTETLASETHPKVQESITAFPAIPVARELAGFLRSVGCDVVIALTHEGYNRDLELARQVPDIDAVVGGHSHTFLDAAVVVDSEGGRRVVVTQDGCFAQNLGVLKLTFDRTGPTEHFTLTNEESQFVPLKPGDPQDDGITAFINDYAGKLDKEMSKVVCAAGMDFPVDEVRLKENPLADMVADALREVTKADVAIFNGGNFRSGLSAGPVTFGELYQVLPYDNFLMKVKVSGAKLREILNYAATRYGAGGFPQVSGMRLHYVDGVLTEVTVAGAPLDDAAEYTLLVTDFVASGGDGYPLKEDPYGASFTGLEQRSSFALWASQQGTINGATDGRVVFDWVAKPNPGLQD
jgi:2',3'-cyclic-nucleotide 2'-phosphodiesterase (5'-nucleotidase family)